MRGTTGGTEPRPAASPELLEAVRAGSSDALAEVYRRYGPLVYAAAYRTTGSLPDAEDVVQDVFLGLPGALRRYEEHGRFEAWLRRVAVRCALMKARARGRSREEPVEWIEALPAAAAEPTLERIAAARALEAMPEKLRTVFLLKEVEGYSHAEIGELLGISRLNSATRLFRAWKVLRTTLGEAP
jgi:RNA polymerase sigma-70 factor, ECF subfamily